MPAPTAPPDPWLPAWFRRPGRLELLTGHHLRPVRDVDVDVGCPPPAPDRSGGLCDYGVFEDEEAEVLGHVVLRPPQRPGADADVRWWVADRLVGSELEAVLETEVPRWVRRDWPFTAPRFRGRDLTGRRPPVPPR
ncbi:N-acetyltransferase [Kineococcus terrestris]|uniref:N-acetyltransferase n=1 Tax=Kineococcus terrestris TaxID=2044856 RepID=UPI0034DB46D6